MNSRSRSKWTSHTSRTGTVRRVSGLKPQRRKAKRSRFDTGVQAVRVRRVDVSRGWGLGLGRSTGAEQGHSQASARSKAGAGQKKSSRGTARSGAARGGDLRRNSLRSDPRVPRFQERLEQRGYRPAPHATRAAVALPWGGAIPLNGKTAFNVVVLAMLGWALLWLFTSDRFYVQRVEASGNHQVSSEVLRQVSGLEGYSVFWINPRQVSAQILEALPPIQSVQVHHGCIDQGGLGGWASVQVVERGTEVVWQVAGQRYWVDEEGALHEVRGLASEAEGGAETAQEEPRMVVLDLRPGRPEQVDLEALAGARQLTRLLPEVRSLEYAPGSGLRLRHPRGWLVYLGTGEDMAKKVGVLRAMEVEFAGEDVVQPTLIDLRFPASPYYRLPDENRPAGAD